MAAERIGYEIPAMKKIKLLSLAGIALFSLSQLALAGPRAGGGGFAGGGRFGGSHFGESSGAPRMAPAFSGGGARFSSPRIGGLSRAPQQFSYYSGARMSGLTQHAFVRQQPNRSVTPYASSRATIIRQQNPAGSLQRQNTRVGNSQMTAPNLQSNRVGSIAGRNRVSNSRTSTAATRQSFVKNHAFARHDANWHRDWDKHRAHFHNNVVFVFVDGFWWGLSPAYFPWDYYPYYAYDNYPYDYSDYPNGSYEYYPDDDQSAYPGSDQYGNNATGATISAVQTELTRLGYYRGAIDGVEGDETQAALARYQEDHDLSVTGTLTAATLQSLGLRRSAS
jgi:putative peptidoglycan binding protein